jgi:hypothetical protein
VAQEFFAKMIFFFTFLEFSNCISVGKGIKKNNTFKENHVFNLVAKYDGRTT